MSGFHMLTPNWLLEDAVITSNNEITAAPSTNLGLSQPSRFWRSNTASSIQITIDAGSALAWQGVFFGYHNGYSSDTIRITSNATTGTLFSAPSYDSTALSMLFTGDLTSFSSNHFWHLAPSAQTYRYVGIEINASSNPDGYSQAGIVAIGQVFEPALGPELGSKFGLTTRSEPLQLVNGETIVRAKRSKHFMQMSFVKQSELDAYTFQRIERAYGSDVPLVCKWDTKGTTYQQERIIYGFINWPAGGPFTFVNKEGLFDVEFSVEEM